MAFGAFSLVAKRPGFLERLNLKTQNVSSRSPVVGPVLLGASTAFLASPCSTPILATTLTLLASRAGLGQGIALMSLYSLGFLLIFALLGFGLIKASRLPRAGRWMKSVHALGSLAILGGGVYYVYLAWTGF